VRGFRLGFITEQEFHHIAQCESLDDVKLNLQETDYGTFLQNDASPLSPSTIRDRALEKLVSEFQYLRSEAGVELGRFLDFITVDYMIDNVMLILKATLNNPNVNVAALVDQAHPLGQFKPSTLKTICAFDNSPKGYSELYQTVIIDTPIGPYFQQFLRDEADRSSGVGDVRNILEEMPTTKLENTLRKLYLEDFFNYCQSLGGETAELMGGLLRARADAMAINIALNSFGSSLNEMSMRADRKALYPSIGFLYPEGTGRLAVVGSEEELVEALKPFKVGRGTCWFALTRACSPTQKC
jgi:V-type H+-transporting ATPase subunit d